jgi:hypothetical protein
VPDILRAIFGPRVRLILSGLMVAGTVGYAVPILLFGQNYKAAAFGMLTAALLHVCLFAVLARRLSRVAGVRLLILRVFRLDQTASFIFSGLMRYWRHFGSHLTVVDASLMRQRNSDNSTRTVFLAFFLIVALLVAYVNLAERLLKFWYHDPLFWVWSCGLVAVLAMLPAWVALRIGERRTSSRFMRSREQVRASLRSLEVSPRHLDLSFRHLQAMCHNNTWFLAVKEFANSADVVLMDLRGYSEQRQGCRKEVNFLFDAVPLPHLLFLVDTAMNKDMVEEMLRGCWARLSKRSPNLQLTHPVVRVYHVRDNDERDMQAVLNLLITLAATPDELSSPERAQTASA